MMYLNTYIPWITIIVMFHCFLCDAQNTHTINYTFEKTDSSYSFRGTFMLTALPECLMEICFDYAHIKILAPDAQEVELVAYGKEWNKIRYTFQRYMFFENTSEWYRTSDSTNQRVDFILLSSQNNSLFMPDIISSTGYYQIHGSDSLCTVEYYQECILKDNFITKLYISNVKEEAIEFLYTFLEYAVLWCNNYKQN